MSTDKNNSTQNFMIQGTILAVASIVVRLIGMAYRIPLTRIIGDEGMGLYGCAFEVYNIALLLSSYSLPLAVSKLVSARLAKKQYNNAFMIFKNALVFAICVGLIIGIIVFCFAPGIASGIMNSPMSVYALKVLAPCLFVVAVMGVIRGYFQGQGTMVPTAISQVIEQIVNAIVSIVAGYYLFRAGTAAAETVEESFKNPALVGPAYGAAGGTLGTLTGALAGLIFLILIYIVSRKGFNRLVRRDASGVSESTATIYKVLLATIIPIVLSSALYNICGILDQAIFNHMMDFKDVPYEEYTRLIGMYTGKFLLLINVPLAMANALGASSIPSITASVATGESRHIINNKINAAVRFAMLIAIPSFVGYIAVGGPILILLFEDARPQMYLILAVGAVSVVFYGHSTVSNAILQGLNHMRDPLKNAAISLVIHIGLLFLLLILGLGIYGVVIANAFFSFTMCCLNQRDIRRICGYRQDVHKNFLLPFIAAVVMGITARLVYIPVNALLGNTVACLFSLLIAVGVYAAVLLKVKGLDEGDILQFPKGRTLLRFLRRIKLL